MSRLCPNCNATMITSKYNRAEMYCPNYKTTCKGVKVKAGAGQPVKPVSQFVRHEGSDEQKAIFATANDFTNHLIVPSRAGTGKTFTAVQLMDRIDRKYDVVMVAFGTDARDELLSRAPAHAKNIFTSNQVGFRIIRECHKGTQFVKDKSLILLKSAFGDDWDDDNVKDQMKLYGTSCRIYDLLRSNLTTASEQDITEIMFQYGIELEQPESFPLVLQQVQHLYQQGPKNLNIVDFADQLFLPVYLNMQAKTQYDIVIIDEAQDQNKCQRLLALKIMRPNGKMIIVGDEFQAIYAWRGADKESMNSFEQALSETKPVQKLKLTVCRRCPKLIIRYAQRIVPDIQALPDAPEGEEFDVSMQELLDTVLPEKRSALVICRINAPLVAGCLKLLARGVPATIRGRDIATTLLKLVDKVSKDTDNTFPAFIEALEKWRNAEIAKWGNSLKGVAKIQTVEDNCGCLMSFAEAVDANSKDPIGDIKKKIDSLFNDDKSAKGIEFSSVHKAKGSEHKTVAVLAVRKKGSSIFDVAWNNDEQDRLNIAYVTVTRCAETIYWVDGRPKDFYPESEANDSENPPAPLPGDEPEDHEEV
jgi:superfamily I DNA/RNA helicase